MVYPIRLALNGFYFIAKSVDISELNIIGLNKWTAPIYKKVIDPVGWDVHDMKHDELNDLKLVYS